MWTLSPLIGSLGSVAQSAFLHLVNELLQMDWVLLRLHNYDLVKLEK